MTQGKHTRGSVCAPMPVCRILLALAVWPGAMLCGQHRSNRAKISFPVTALHADGSPWKGLTENDLVLTVNRAPAGIRLEQPWLNGPEKPATPSSEPEAGPVNILFVISYPQMVFDSFAWGGPARRDAARRFQHDSLEAIRKFVAAHAAPGWNMAILNADGHRTAYTTNPATLEELARKMEAEPTPRTLHYCKAGWNTALTGALRAMRRLPGRNWAVSMGDALSRRWAQQTYAMPSRMIPPVTTILYARYPEWSVVRAARDAGVLLVACNTTVHAGEKHYPPAASYPFRARLHTTGENYGGLPFYANSLPIPRTMEIAEIDPKHADKPAKPALFGNPGKAQIVSYRHRLVAIYLQSLKPLPDLVNAMAAGQYDATAIVPAGTGLERIEMHAANTENSATILAYPLRVRLHSSQPVAGKQHASQ